MGAAGGLGDTSWRSGRGPRRLPQGFQAQPARPEPGSARRRARVTETAVAAVGAQSPASPSFRIRVMKLAAPLGEQGIRIVPLALFSGEEEARFREGSMAAKLAVVRGGRRRVLASLRELGDCS